MRRLGKDSKDKEGKKEHRRRAEEEAAREAARMREELRALRAELGERVALLSARVAGQPSWAELRGELAAWRAAVEGDLRRERTAGAGRRQVREPDGPGSLELARSERGREEAEAHSPLARQALAGAALLAIVLLLLGGLGLKALWDLGDAARELARREVPASAVAPEEPGAGGGVGGRGDRAGLLELAREADAESWRALAAELGALDPEAAPERALEALCAFSSRGEPALAPLVLAVLENDAASPALRAAALACVEPCGVRAALPEIEDLARGAGPLRGEALALLARAWPASPALERALEEALARADGVGDVRELLALLEALLRPPLHEGDSAAESRAALVRTFAERLLREPFRLATDPAGRVLLAVRGQDGATLDLTHAWNSAGFERALGQLLSEAAAEPSLARLHARVDRLGLAPLAGGERTRRVALNLGPGSALHLRGGELLTSAHQPRCELDIRPGPDGAPLVARPLGGEWRALAFVESPSTIAFELVEVGSR